MKNMDYYLPCRLVTGKGCVSEKGDILSALGRRCLLVSGRHGAKASGALQDVCALLARLGIAWELFDEVEQNPLISTARRAGAAAAGSGAEFVVGIGGGSALDCAKMAAVFAHNDLPGDSIHTVQKRWERPPLPIVLVGTTAGTGSEINKYSVMTSDRTGRKKSVGADCDYASVVFGDPKYTLSLPYRYTVSTALDALAHASEGYFSKAANEMTDAAALAAVEHIVPTLLALREDGPISWEQRENLYYGSLFGGMVIAHIGTCCCHAFGYYLTEEFAVPHGTACAFFLPDYLSRAKGLLPQKAERYERACGRTIETLGEAVRRINAYTPPPLTPDELAQVAARRWTGPGAGANQFLRTPGRFGEAEIREAFLHAFLSQS